MLTADLSGARRRGKELYLPVFSKKRMETLTRLASEVVDVYLLSTGKNRAEVAEALGAIEVGARDRKLLMGLKKIAEDKASFESTAREDLPELRLQLFAVAAAMRRECRGASSFDRDAALEQVAKDLEMATAQELDAQLFADLKEAQRLSSTGIRSVQELMDAYRLGRVQAVLLRSTQVRAQLTGVDADGARQLFRRLKLHQLLFSLEENKEGFALTLDGPMSLFEQTTRYGVRLAACLPLLCAFGRCDLEADVLWGKARTRVAFSWSSTLLGEVTLDGPGRRIEIDDLVADFRRLDSPWSVKPSDAWLHMPGVGMCLPDLAFTHQKTGEMIHFELLGYWSREAVWKRVELVEKGLQTPLIFGVSSRLRVSPKALPAKAPAAIVVFKGKISARSVLRSLQAVQRGET